MVLLLLVPTLSLLAAVLLNPGKASFDIKASDLQMDPPLAPGSSTPPQGSPGSGLPAALGLSGTSLVRESL